MSKTYRPLGTKVLLRVLPPEEPDHKILLPEGQQHPNRHQYFEVVAVGSFVNDDRFKLNPGEQVMIHAHQSQMIGVSKEEQLLLIDRDLIVCVIEREPVVLN